MDVLKYNRQAWNRRVELADKWTVPVDSDTIARARKGDWGIVLTPLVPVPQAWFEPLAGSNVLCLACGGGQQGPVLAAAGARVTVFDNAEKQLAQDRMVAERDGLALETVLGDMADLSMFADGSFDLIFHPVANCFVPDVRPVWRECHRVLRTGGALLSGFANPLMYCFDYAARERGELVLRHRIPYSDITSIDDRERQRWIDADEPLEFGHSLNDQIGGQLDAGLLLAAMYEDIEPPVDGMRTISHYIPTFIATRAIKP
jgi:SAM-dependent methyltransferase